MTALNALRTHPVARQNNVHQSERLHATAVTRPSHLLVETAIVTVNPSAIGVRMSVCEDVIVMILVNVVGTIRASDALRRHLEGMIFDEMMTATANVTDALATLATSVLVGETIPVNGRDALLLGGRVQGIDRRLGGLLRRNALQRGVCTRIACACLGEVVVGTMDTDGDECSLFETALRELYHD